MYVCCSGLAHHKRVGGGVSRPGAAEGPPRAAEGLAVGGGGGGADRRGVAVGKAIRIRYIRVYVLYLNKLINYLNTHTHTHTHAHTVRRLSQIRKLFGALELEKSVAILAQTWLSLAASVFHKCSRV